MRALRVFTLSLFALLSAAVGGGACGGAAWVQSVEVAPVSVLLQPGQRTAVLTLANRSTTPFQVQVRPFLWQQARNEEQLLPTEVLAVSPPFAQVGPGQTQTIRMVLRQSPAEREASYRVLIDELPQAQTAGTVQIALRLSVPVFAMPAGGHVPDVSGQVVIGRQGPALVLQNGGAVHLRVLGATLAGGGAPVAVQTVARPYVLPGAERTWPIAGAPQLRPGATAMLTAQTDSGPLTLAVPIARAP